MAEHIPGAFIDETAHIIIYGYLIIVGVCVFIFVVDLINDPGGAWARLMLDISTLITWAAIYASIFLFGVGSWLIARGLWGAGPIKW